MTWPNPPAPGSSTHRKLTFVRFAALRPGTRYWAAGKLAFDPMFRQLEPFLPDDGRILDLGCGYGLVAAWTAMARPNVRLVGVDPLLSRVRVARYVLEGRATAHVGDAQELLSARLPSWAAEPFDAALCIDVTHQGSGLVAVLAGLHRVLRQGGVLLLRTATKEHEQRESWSMGLERLLVRARGQRVIAFPSAAQVTAALLAAGFRDVRTADRVRGEPEMLFIARRCA
jgi:SAM-dependent methyltransferase